MMSDVEERICAMDTSKENPYLTIEESIRKGQEECFEATGRDYEILDEEIYG